MVRDDPSHFLDAPYRYAMKIRTLPHADQSNGWSLILPPRTPNKPLGKSIHVDWLVFGAGYAGLAAARRLAELKTSSDIAIVDAGTIGNNASGRNSGFAIDVPHNVGSSLAELKKAHHYQRLLTAGVEQLEFLIRKHAIDCQWRRAGKYHCAVSPHAEKTLTQHVAELQHLGEPFEWHERESLWAHLGTRYYRSGFYTPGCIFMDLGVRAYLAKELWSGRREC